MSNYPDMHQADSMTSESSLTVLLLFRAGVKFYFGP